jgi:shikimate dehydrogenase
MTSFAVIGKPLRHTLSPVLHNHIFELLELEAQYKAWEVPADALGKVANQLQEGHLSGINITLPHKTTFLPFLDDISQDVKLSGAVNCVSVEQGRLLGHNTDIRGILYALEYGNHHSEGQRVLILGNGGGARAAITALLYSGVSHITVAGRRMKAVNQFVRDFKDFAGDTSLDTGQLDTELDTASYQLLINTTSVGMWPETELAPLKKKQLHPSQTIFDFIYRPIETLLQQWALEKGCRVIGGIEMFIGQGLASLKQWFPGKIYQKQGELNPRLKPSSLRSFLLTSLKNGHTAVSTFEPVENVV